MAPEVAPAAAQSPPLDLAAAREWLELPAVYHGSAEYFAGCSPVNNAAIERARRYVAEIAHECWGGVLRETKPDLAAMNADLIADKSALLVASARQFPDVEAHSVHILDGTTISSIEFQPTPTVRRETHTVSTSDAIVWWSLPAGPHRDIARSRPIDRSMTAPTMALGRLSESLASHRIALTIAEQAGAFRSAPDEAAWSIEAYSWEDLERLRPVVQGYGTLELPGRYQAVLARVDGGMSLRAAWLDCRGNAMCEETLRWDEEDRFPRQYLVRCFAPGTTTCVFERRMIFSPVGDDEVVPESRWTPAPGDVVTDTRFGQPVRYTVGPNARCPDVDWIRAESARVDETPSERRDFTAVEIPKDPDEGREREAEDRADDHWPRTLVWGSALVASCGIALFRLRKRLR